MQTADYRELTVKGLTWALFRRAGVLNITQISLNSAQVSLLTVSSR